MSERPFYSNSVNYGADAVKCTIGDIFVEISSDDSIFRRGFNALS